MIRRNPTLIPMGDSDVQSVRELLAAQRKKADGRKEVLDKMRKCAQNPDHLNPEDYDLKERLGDFIKQYEEFQRNHPKNLASATSNTSTTENHVTK